MDTTATAKHTPGLWTYKRYQATTDTHHHAITATVSDDGRAVTVATVYPISDDGQEGAESHANAALIAAAPEMLEALRDLLKQMDEWKQKKGAGSIEYWAGPGQQAALAAIAKAEGE